MVNKYLRKSVENIPFIGERKKGWIMRNWDLSLYIIILILVYGASFLLNNVLDMGGYRALSYGIMVIFIGIGLFIVGFIGTIIKVFKQKELRWLRIIITIIVVVSLLNIPIYKLPWI